MLGGMEHQTSGTTIMPDGMIERRFPRNMRQVREEILPLLASEERQWTGRGRQQAWALTRSLEDVQKGDGDPAHALNALWQQIDAIDASTVR